MSDPIVAELYTKDDCCLCREMKLVIERVRRDHPMVLREIDVTSDPMLLARFGEEIPVLFLDGRKVFKYRTSDNALKRRLKLALLQRRMLRTGAQGPDR